MGEASLCRGFVNHGHTPLPRGEVLPSSCLRVRLCDRALCDLFHTKPRRHKEARQLSCSVEHSSYVLREPMKAPKLSHVSQFQDMLRVMPPCGSTRPLSELKS